VTVAGISLAIWARRHLGTNWSATISILFRQGFPTIQGEVATVIHNALSYPHRGYECETGHQTK
jgi:hypothetical protein